jgi:hypothetical protein
MKTVTIYRKETNNKLCIFSINLPSFEYSNDVTKFLFISFDNRFVYKKSDLGSSMMICIFGFGVSILNHKQVCYY